MIFCSSEDDAGASTRRGSSSIWSVDGASDKRTRRADVSSTSNGNCGRLPPDDARFTAGMPGSSDG